MNSATINAFSNPGWEFDEWTEEDTTVSTDPEYSFLVENQRSFVANFSVEGYEVVTTAIPLDGGTTAGDSAYSYLDSVIIIADPNPGWFFDHWQEEDTVVTTDTVYSFEITSDRTFEAYFYRELYEVFTAAYPLSGGFTYGDGFYWSGDTVTISATPSMNYEFREWAENGSTICTDPEYTFIVDTNRNFTAYFDYLFDIEEVNLNTFKIYPVPSKGMISLSFNSKEIFIDELALMNLSGEYILRKSIGEAGSRSIDLTGNPRGVYLLQLLFNGKVIGCKKIVLH